MFVYFFYFCLNYFFPFFCFRPRKEGGEKKERKPRKPRKPKETKKKLRIEEDDGLTAKQRRKVVSKALISSSEGSDSDDGEKLRIDEKSVNTPFLFICLLSLSTGQYLKLFIQINSFYNEM